MAWTADDQNDNQEMTPEAGLTPRQEGIRESALGGSGSAETKASPSQEATIRNRHRTRHELIDRLALMESVAQAQVNAERSGLAKLSGGPTPNAVEEPAT